MNRGNKNVTVTDEELIRRFQEGDKDVFPMLIKRHMNMVFNLCNRMMGDYDEANDCAQETFVKIYRGLDLFKFRSSFTTWIYRIAVNNCKNRLSSSHYRFSRRAVSLDTSADGERLPVQAGDDRSNPETRWERDEQMSAIRTAVGSLPDDLRILVVLRDFEGRPYEDIADICRMKLGTVKSKLARARHILRESLKGAL